MSDKEPELKGWNHRIIRHVENPPVYYAIHEVYYDAEGNVAGWGASPVSILGDNVEGLTWTVERILEGLKRPVIDSDALKLMNTTPDQESDSV